MNCSGSDTALLLADGIPVDAETAANYTLTLVRNATQRDPARALPMRCLETDRSRDVSRLLELVEELVEPHGVDVQMQHRSAELAEDRAAIPP